MSKENEKINSELHSLFVEHKNDQTNYNSIINEKDSQIKELTAQINNLDINIEKYEDTLITIRNNYDNTVHEYQNEINRKNEDIKYLIDNHAKENKEVNKNLCLNK